MSVRRRKPAIASRNVFCRVDLPPPRPPSWPHQKEKPVPGEVLSSPPPSIVRSVRIVLVYFLDLVLGVVQSLVRTMGDFCGV